ncbi:DEAD/DEAH box helicase [Arthrobacter caoxuetaonis]|uniref:DEAD/DEAH box helicase family protein n=1 Tax=Arthrobacter caoxuetaonis TaxID=2886935 RepID=A0A9X1MGQ5_9MICC|nr:DEAD/DEAH box helicase family protein [Arthrobacter caoxuetaonis]MCC3299296.1 DEAD/DEAH box helicase family protein [Arthrobacter caoxuetaonis]USQ59211.1 DEAD/DEAH box helicase family protein [Arthrobacter caoxuetaonis]
MKFTLTDYQHDVTNTVVQRLNSAVAMFDNDGGRTAVGLTAPTGAGKTVVATAVLEKLLFGGGIQSPNRNLTVLWLTDDPSLNEQSKDKILKASSVIQPSQIEMIDSTYDRDSLEPGKIHFLNIGRLTKGATGHTVTGDNRRWSLWETIGNTVARRNRDFLFIVDEAHRGSSVKAGDKKTIMRTILDGGPVEVPDASGAVRTIVNPPVAVMLGISATPAKFEAAMRSNDSDRMLMKVSADIMKVRESGMIKDLIQVNHPTDNQPTDDTLVRAAVRDLKEYDKLWAEEASISGRARSVNPLLVIQVPDKISAAAVGTLVASLTDEWTELQHQPGTPVPIVHSFGEKSPIDLPGGRVIPHMAPELIEENTHVRVVIFKAALTTGWDCPRAEVMVSLRAAKEHTAIAQLIGRMVRTPVAGRIEEPGLEELNSVSLYLPHYSRDEVARVVMSFVGDADIEIPVSVNPVVFERAAGLPEALWELELPTETKPRKLFTSQTARLATLGSRLDNLGIQNPFNPSVTLTEEVEQRVTAILMAEYARLKTGIDEEADGLLEVTYDRVGYDQYDGRDRGVTALKVRASAENLRELKAKALKGMPDASGSWLYAALYEDLDDDQEAITRLSAMASNDDIISTLEASAAALIDSWRQAFNPAVSRLGTADKTALDEIWHPHGQPLRGTFTLPKTVKTKTQKLVPGKVQACVEDIETFTGHVFAAADGKFPMVATGWEREVIEKELAQVGLIGWYRNPASASQGLSVSYTEGKVDKSLYPDFLFFHEVDGELAVDLVDPHNHNLADAPGKWSALARFARENPGVFRRVTAVIRNSNGILKGLDLAGRASTVVEDRLAACSGGEDIAQVFEEFGGNY